MEDKKIKKPNPAFVVFEKKGTRIYIMWRYRTRFKINDEGFYDCHIPEFEIFFNADSKEEIDHKARTFMRMFFDYYAEGPKMNVRNLSVSLIRLGFRPTNGLADTSKLTRNKIVPTKFKSPVFAATQGTDEVELEDELVA